MAEFSSLNGYQVKDAVARSIAKGRNQAVTFVDYETMIEALNGLEKDEYRAGQNIYIGVVGVPDLWVYGTEDIVHNFEYVSDEDIVEMLKNNTTIQVGYYKLAMLEGQKVDLTTYDQHLAKHDEDIAGLNESLTNENSETFNFGVKDGVRGFFTNPSRADDSFIPFSAKTPYIDVRGLTSNTSNEYFDFSVTANALTDDSPFYKVVNGDTSSFGSNGWYSGRNSVTVNVKLKKHIPAAFLLNVSGVTASQYAVGAANLNSYTNIIMDATNGRQYLFRPTCGVGESFTLTFTSGYEWVSFLDFHLRAY